MDKMVDAIQIANQVKELSDRQAVKTQVAYAFGAGITCVLAMGLALFVHAGLGIISKNRKLLEQNAQQDPNAGGGARATSHSGDIVSNAPHIPDRPAPYTSSPAPAKASADPHIGRPASNTVKLYYALQLEELTKYKLSTTEQRVAALVLHGETNKDIAKKLRLAESTIKKHVQKILAKTGTTSRIEFNHLIKTALEKR